MVSQGSKRMGISIILCNVSNIALFFKADDFVIGDWKKYLKLVN